MAKDLKLNELDAVLEDLPYPLTRDEARAELGDVTLVYADGEEPLPLVLDRVGDDAFDSPDDLEAAIFNVLPTEAVGEPGQSEGEG